MKTETISIRRGLDIPILGSPRQIVMRHLACDRVALLGPDYPGLKPSLLVREGERVQRGQVLFVDRKNPLVRFTAPAAGTIVAIHRGEQRAFQSVVVEKSGGGQVRFAAHAAKSPDRYDAAAIRELLAESGLWTALRARPYGKIPSSDSKPRAILVNVMDTNPLAANPLTFVQEHAEAFRDGLLILSKLALRVRVCAAPSVDVPMPSATELSLHRFHGPHPAGLTGTHVHFLEPIGAGDCVWSINYADVVAIGHLFRHGELLEQRIIAIAGPAVKEPALYRVDCGAHVPELTQGLLKDGEVRAISGSVLSGHAAEGPLAFLGRYHLQISAIEEGRQRELLGWQRPGFNKFSVKRAYLGGWMPWRRFNFTSSTEGSPRAIVPVGVFERVMPQDTEPTFLARALASHDVELAVNLGALEMDEEDVGLLSFVCPGKHDYGDLLRAVLTSHEKDG